MIHIQATIHAYLDKVWHAYNNPQDIVLWNQASPDWHCPSAENDLRTGGTFKSRMESKDGSFGFDFEGEYTEVTPLQSIAYKMADGRRVFMKFKEEAGRTIIDIDFDAETINPVEMQQQGWQAILNSFKNYIENKV